MLILARHGRTAANASGLLQGRVDNPLDAVGLRQAQDIAGALGRPARLVASPLLRTRQTADAFGLPVEIDKRWIELDYGTWDERPVRDVPAETWAQWRADDSFALPGGESLASLQLRVGEAIESLSEEARDHDVVVLTHVSPIKAAIGWALGVGAATSWRMNVSQASITRLRTGKPGPAMLSFNEVWHLGN